MRNILITNDDGIQADGLRRLAAAAASFGQIWVVAPDTERSALSHGITLREPLEVLPYEFPVQGVRAFSCSGSPADCVRVGGLSVMGAAPDLVLSGVNYNYNVASDVQYSATVGAAFEGAFQGWHSIAFSEGTDAHVVTDAYLEKVLEMLIDAPLGHGQIFNVNFPGCALDEYRGILENRTVSKGMVFRDHYNMIEERKDGGKRWMVEGVYTPEAEEGTDYRAVLDNYISIGIVNNVG